MKILPIASLLPASFVIQIVPALNEAVLFLEIPTSKNSISAGPFVTNQESLAVIERDQILRAVNEAYSDFPMDYGNPIGGPQLQIVVQVESQNTLGERIRGLERAWPEYADRLRPLLTCHGLLRTPEVVNSMISANTTRVVVRLSRQRIPVQR